MKTTKQRKKRKGNGFFIIICLCCLAVAGKLIYDKLYDYAQTDKKYEELREEVIIQDGNSRTINWEKFKGTDVVAWIECGDIDYPVVHGENNDYYLHHSYDSNAYTFSGSIFMNSHNSKTFSDNNTIIYGHNMKNGSMFGLLSRYLDENYTDTKEFYIYRPDGTKHIYKMFAAAHTLYNSRFYDYKFETIEDYQDYQKETKKASEAKYKIRVNPERKMVTLSTCASMGSAQGKRVVLVGMEEKVIQVQEPASWWKENK